MLHSVAGRDDQPLRLIKEHHKKKTIGKSRKNILRWAINNPFVTLPQVSLGEQTHLLADILANAYILLAFEPLSEYIQYRFFSANEPLPGDPSHLLYVHYKF